MNAASSCAQSLSSGSLAASATTPRVTISGDPDEPAVCARMATTGSDDAITGQVPPIPDDLVGDLADARVVDQHAAGRRLGDDGPTSCRTACTSPFSASTIHRLRSRRASRARPRARCCARWRNSPCTGTKNGPHQREHQLELLFAAVPRHVDVTRRLGDHLGAAAGHVIHDSTDGLFVAGNSARRQHDRVAGRASRGDGRRWRFATAPSAARPAIRSRCRAPPSAGTPDVPVADLHAGRDRR